MRERNAAVGGDSQRRGHARNHFERDARFNQRFHFLTAAAEDERVAALQPNDREPAPRALDHHGADLFLREGVHGFLLADVDALAILAREIEQVLVGKMIVEHGVGEGEQLAALPGDEVRVARAGSNQIDLTHVTVAHALVRAAFTLV